MVTQRYWFVFGCTLMNATRLYIHSSIVGLLVPVQHMYSQGFDSILHMMSDHECKLVLW